MSGTSSPNLRPVAIWLLTGCFLVAAMVVIGGITRLTQSGLSIVDWRPVTGILPPLNEEQWLEEFAKYQTSPQFKLVNSSFTLDDFKGIFWWEYIHRLLGRIIGIVFFIPFLLFIYQKKLKGKLLRQSLMLLVLGGLQGFIGWIMVASGLQDMPHVSHYRLALHLITAFFVFAFTLWVALDILEKKPVAESNDKQWLRKQVRIFFPLLVLQIIYGAFVAGLKAGSVSNTFPLMNGEFIPSVMGEGFSFMGMQSLTEFPVTVHFLHRMIAYTIFFFVIYLFYRGIKSNDPGVGQVTKVLAAATAFQVLLGIFTVLTTVNINLAVIHQAGALILWTATWWSLHRTRRSA